MSYVIEIQMFLSRTFKLRNSHDSTNIHHCFPSCILLQVHSASVRARAAREQIRAISCAPSETTDLLLTDQNGPRVPFSKRFIGFFSDAIVFLMHNALGYALMLSVMVYSGWLFAAVVIGMGLGYFVFGHLSMKINMENVQARTTKVICEPSCSVEAATSGRLRLYHYQFSMIC